LRDLLKLQSKSAGRLTGSSARKQAICNAQWLEGTSVRLLCLLTLDRFADYVSDQASKQRRIII
jgi:TATA-binding protein-associated factor